MEIVVANTSHIKYADIICQTIEESAKQRGTGIAKRTPAYIRQKIEESKAVIALDKEAFAGFCYIETWESKKFVANSGLVVHPAYRGRGLAKDIKKKILNYSIQKYPDSKVFGITTGLAVMKINYELGYQPVTFSELTTDESFWKGCSACKNYDILLRNDHKMCLCTGMLYNVEKSKKEKIKKYKAIEKIKKLTQSLKRKKIEK